MYFFKTVKFKTQGKTCLKIQRFGKIIVVLTFSRRVSIRSVVKTSVDSQLQRFAKIVTKIAVAPGTASHSSCHSRAGSTRRHLERGGAAEQEVSQGLARASSSADRSRVQQSPVEGCKSHDSHSAASLKRSGT